MTRILVRSVPTESNTVPKEVKVKRCESEWHEVQSRLTQVDCFPGAIAASRCETLEVELTCAQLKETQGGGVNIPTETTRRDISRGPTTDCVTATRSF